MTPDAPDVAEKPTRHLTPDEQNAMTKALRDSTKLISRGKQAVVMRAMLRDHAIAARLHRGGE